MKKFSEIILLISLLFLGVGLTTSFFIFVKILYSIELWLEHGRWKFAWYQSACDFFGFNCFPATNYVKIDAFLKSFYQFDVTFFILILGFWIFLLFSYVFGRFLKYENSSED